MSKKDKPVAQQTPVAIAVAALFPVFDALQVATDVSVANAKSRSESTVAAIKILHETSIDYAADCVALFGDGKKGTKLAAGVKGALADAMIAKYGDRLHVTVRSAISIARKVAENWNNPAVRAAAEKSGIRAGYDAAKPKAAPEVDTAPVAAPVAYSQSTAVEFVAAHFDDVVFALRAYFLRAADTISIAKLGEIEVHLAGKTRKQA